MFTKLCSIKKKYCYNDCGKLKKLKDQERSQLEIVLGKEKGRNNKLIKDNLLTSNSNFNDFQIQPLSIEIPKKGHKHRRNHSRKKREIIIQPLFSEVPKGTHKYHKRHKSTINKETNPHAEVFIFKNLNAVLNFCSNLENNDQGQNKELPIVLDDNRQCELYKPSRNTSLVTLDTTPLMSTIVTSLSKSKSPLKSIFYDNCVTTTEPENLDCMEVVRKYSNLCKSQHKVLNIHSLSGYRSPSKETSLLGLTEEAGQGESYHPSELKLKPYDVSEAPFNDRGRKHSNSINVQSMLTAEYFTPLEIVPCAVATVKYHPIDKKHASEDVSIRHSKPSQHSLDSSPSALSRTDTATNVCGKTFVREKRVHVGKSPQGVPVVQPVLGYCTCGRCTQGCAIHTKYSLVKITQFNDFRTYEIMRPYNTKPKDIPTCIAEIFVVAEPDTKYGDNGERRNKIDPDKTKVGNKGNETDSPTDKKSKSRCKKCARSPSKKRSGHEGNTRAESKISTSVPSK